MQVGLHASTDTKPLETRVVDRLTAEQGLHDTIKPYHELTFTHGTERVTIYLAPAQLSAVANALAAYQTVDAAAPDLELLWENYKASRYALDADAMYERAMADQPAAALG